MTILFFAFVLDHVVIHKPTMPINTGKSQSATKEVQHCLDMLKESREKCLTNLIEKTLKTKGLDSAFNMLDLLFENGIPASVDCHSLMHKFGTKAYQLFSQHSNFSLSPKTSYCGYGFYHGFMEEFVHLSKNIDDARKFCDYVQKSLESQSADAGGACYHGIGHGLIEDVPEITLWGKPQAIIDRGLGLCEWVSDTTDRLYRCVTGVYNAYEIIASQRKYKLSHDKNDPFKICRSQKEAYQDACYSQLAVVAGNLAGGDYYKALLYIRTITNDSYATTVVTSIMVDRARTNPEDIAQSIAICRSLDARFEIACIRAVGEGYLKYGKPQEEYNKAIAFCNNSELTQKEKAACFDRIMPILRIWYTKEKAVRICRSVDKMYQINQCMYN